MNTLFAMHQRIACSRSAAAADPTEERLGYAMLIARSSLMLSLKSTQIPRFFFSVLVAIAAPFINTSPYFMNKQVAVHQTLART